jgi:hypothetical protein
MVLYDIDMLPTYKAVFKKLWNYLPYSFALKATKTYILDVHRQWINHDLDEWDLADLYLYNINYELPNSEEPPELEPVQVSNQDL